MRLMQAAACVLASFCGGIGPQENAESLHSKNVDMLSAVAASAPPLFS